MDIVDILSIPEESQYIEFKRLDGKSVVKKILETIVALVNTEGGKIILGVDDPEKTSLKGVDRVFGIEENPELYDEVSQHLENIHPSIGTLISSEEIEVTSEKTIIIIHVSKSKEYLYSYLKKAYIRKRKSNLLLDPSQILTFSYAKGFSHADKELVEDVHFSLLDTQYYKDWMNSPQRRLSHVSIEDNLLSVGLARYNDHGVILPTRAAVLLFSEHPTYLMETKSAIRIFQYLGKKESITDKPNLLAKPITIEGPLIDLIARAHQEVLHLLQDGIMVPSGFVTKYKIPERAIKEAITNAIIHRDYHIKKDVEIRIFEDRVEIESPGLFPFNITKSNIGKVRSEGYRNHLLVKHLREFSSPPNLDQNEGIRAMRNEMFRNNLYPPVFVTYPDLDTSVKLILTNEIKPSEWEKIYDYLVNHHPQYLDNPKAREITGTVQRDRMSQILRSWVDQGLLERIPRDLNVKKHVRYKLSEDIS